MPLIFCCNFVSSIGCHRSNSCWLPCADFPTTDSPMLLQSLLSQSRSDFFTAKKAFWWSDTSYTILFTPYVFFNGHWLFHCLRGTSEENPWSIFQWAEQAHTDNSSKVEEESEPGHITHCLITELLLNHYCLIPWILNQFLTLCQGTAVVALGARGTTEGWGKHQFTFQDSHNKFSCGAVPKLQRKGTTGQAAQAAQGENVELMTFISPYNAALHSCVDVRTLQDLLWSAGAGGNLGNLQTQKWWDLLKCRVPFSANLNLY